MTEPRNTKETQVSGTLNPTSNLSLTWNQNFENEKEQNMSDFTFIHSIRIDLLEDGEETIIVDTEEGPNEIVANLPQMTFFDKNGIKLEQFFTPEKPEFKKNYKLMENVQIDLFFINKGEGKEKPLTLRQDIGNLWANLLISEKYLFNLLDCHRFIIHAISKKTISFETNLDFTYTKCSKLTPNDVLYCQSKTLSHSAIYIGNDFEENELFLGKIGDGGNIVALNQENLNKYLKGENEKFLVSAITPYNDIQNPIQVDKVNKKRQDCDSSNSNKRLKN